MTSTALRTIDTALPIGSLDAYIAHVNQIPLLTADEEKELSERLFYHEDIEAAKRLVMAHLRYVVRIARGYMGYGLPLGDLIQEGNAGLMKAVKRFDPNVGVRLVSFAVHWIKAEIHEFILKNWRIVKVATTKAQRKLFFNLRSMKKRLGWANREEVAEVAEDLGVTPEQVVAMEQRLQAVDMAYDAPAQQQDDATYLAPANYLEDKSSDPAHILEMQDSMSHHQEALMVALKTLDERSLDIIKARWFAEKKATLHDLAAKYGVSAERIRQLEQNAMKKLRKSMS